MIPEILKAASARLDQFLLMRGLGRGDQLGYGKDGIVCRTSDSSSAVKSFVFQEHFERELNAYLRLQERDVRKVGIFSVPRLRFHDSRILIIEMDIVSPPFIVDFADSRIDRRFSIPEETYDDWEEMFGKHWPDVDEALSILRGHGIHLSDLSHKNVNCGDCDED